tara:strand:+ start:13654 stop:15864 length:2211 start_codon:yes stop_codon:yes gene_type:complete
MSKLTTISGYVPTRPFSELDSDRYDYITLDQTEPNLSVPDSDFSLVQSHIDGTRKFTTDPRLSALSFQTGKLPQIAPTNPSYFLVLKNLPGSQAGIGKDDSVAWSIGDFEEVDTLDTVTTRGNTTLNDITIGNLAADSATFTGGVRIQGDLYVDGTETVINSTTLTVDDKNITIAQGSIDNISADGAGITVDGSNAIISYNGTTDRWTMNKDFDIDNQYIGGTLYFDGVSDQDIVNQNGILGLNSTQTNIKDGAAGIATFTSSAITLDTLTTASDSVNLQGEIRATNVPPKADTVKVLFRRQSDGLVMEGDIEEALTDKLRIEPTNEDLTHYLLVSQANAGAGGVDSVDFDTDLTYNPFSNTLTLANIVSTGLADLDSTNVAGDLQIKTDPNISKSGRLLDSAGRSFVIYDSSGQLLWGNNGTSSGNLGGAAAVNLNLNDLSDVNVGGVTDGQVLKYDATAGLWINGTDLVGAGGGGIALTDLSVTQNANAGTGTLSYNDLNGVFSYTPPDLSTYSTVTTLLGLTDVTGDGTNGQVLSTDGAGSFSFVDQTGGGGGSQNLFQTIAVAGQSNVVADTTTDTLTLSGSGGIAITTTAGTDTINIAYTGAATGLASRATANNTATSLGNNSSVNMSIGSPAPSTYALLKIATSHACWVTLYTDTAARTADAGRVITSDPALDAGVISEIISTGNETVKMSPGVVGWLDNSETVIPIKIQNLSGGTASIQVTLTYVQLEA